MRYTENLLSLTCGALSVTREFNLVPRQAIEYPAERGVRPNNLKTPAYGPEFIACLTSMATVIPPHPVLSAPLSSDYVSINEIDHPLPVQWNFHAKDELGPYNTVSVA